MKIWNWSEIPSERMSETLSRRYFSSERMTVSRVFLKKGCVVPTHAHENEQLSMVLSGALKFGIGGKEITVRAGETLQIAPNEPHSAVAVEDTDVLDLFAPTRADWLEGKDGYLRA
jgi:quercetin dioxygenase-like cupin family protein